MISALVAPEIRPIARSEVNAIVIDWGENTAGSETGALKAGDTVATCVVAVDQMPAGASSPTLGAVSANGSAMYVNRRECSAGEATTCNITTSATQEPGIYLLKFTATTTNSKVIPRFVRIKVEVPLVDNAYQ